MPKPFMNADQPAYELLMERGPDPGLTFLLTAPSHTVGRDPISDLCISDPEVSRQHALLIRVPSGGYKIQDLGSTNGTIVDSVRLSGEAYALQPGQTIALGGSVALHYRLTEVLADEVEPALDELAAAPLSPDIPEEQPLPEPEVLESEPAALLEAEQPSEWRARQPVRAQADSPPLDQMPRAVQPAVEAFVDAAPEEIDDPGRRVLSIALGVLLVLLCLCCSVTTFLYYYGGDWFLRQFGVVP